MHWIKRLIKAFKGKPRHTYPEPFDSASAAVHEYWGFGIYGIGKHFDDDGVFIAFIILSDKELDFMVRASLEYDAKPFGVIYHVGGTPFPKWAYTGPK